MQLPVAVARGVDVRLAASQLGEPLPLAVLRGQVGQPLDGRGIGRLQRDERLEGRSLGLAVATPRGHPGAQLEHPGLRKARRGQMARRADDLVGPAGGLGPVEPGAPDRGVVGPRPLAPREPVAGLVETPGAGRQVGQAEPDAVVVGGDLSARSSSRRPARSDTAVVELPEGAQSFGGITLRSTSRCKKPPVLVVPAGDPVSRPSSRRASSPISPSPGLAALEARLGESVAPLSRPAGRAPGRELGLLRLVRNTAPGREGGFGMALDSSHTRRANTRPRPPGQRWASRASRAPA